MRDPRRGGPQGARLDLSSYISRARGPGFTLAELLVVILVIGVLVGLLLPAVARLRAAERTIACLARLRAIHTAARVYADAYGLLPLSAPEKAIPEFELPTVAWRCPEDRAAPPLTQAAYSAYEYLAVLYMDPPPTGLDFTKMKPRTGLRRYEANPLLPLFRDVAPNHEKDRNVVFWNGSARWGWD